MISTAYATETPRPRTPPRQHPGGLHMFGSDSSASDSEDSTETSSSSSSSHSSGDEIHEEKDVETIVIRVIKKGSAEYSLWPLLEKRGSEISLTEAMVRAAKKNKYDGALMVQMLLANANRHQKAAAATGKRVVEDKALLAALELFDSEPEFGWLGREREYGTKVEEMVIVGFWGQVAISCYRLQMIVSRSPNALEIMKTLLSERSTASSSSLRPRPRITEAWMIAAAVNSTCGAKLMSLLLREQSPGDDVSITGTVLEVAARNEGSAKEIFELLFSKRREELRIKPRVLVAACGNYECAGTVTELLLSANEGKTIRITESMVLATKEDEEFKRRNSFLTFMGKPKEDQPMKQLLKKIISRPYKICFTQQALCAFAKLGDTDLLKHLLSEGAPASQFKIPPSMVEAAASNAGVEVMELLFRERGKEVQITERVLLAAVGNKDLGLDIVEFLFRECAGELRVTERMLELAVGGESYRRSDMLKILLSHAGGDVHVTTEMVGNAVSKGYKIGAVLAMLPQAGKHDIQISERLLRPYAEENLKTLLEAGHGLRFSRGAVLAVAKWDDPELIALFLQKNGDSDDFQEAMLIAAIDSICRYEEIMAVFLAQPWGCVKITERMILAAYRVYYNVERLEKLVVQLLQKYGDAVQFEEEAIEAIMQFCDSNVVLLLLQKPGNRFQITSRMIESIAKNEYHRYDVLELLLQERCSEIPITEGVVEAFLDKEMGSSILLLLLSERGEVIQLTERLLEFAARKSQTLWDWILWESDREIQLTERVVEGVASNEWGDAMLRKLLGEYGDAIQITERVLEAAVENASEGEEIVEFLLDERGDNIYISERIMEAAARNSKSGVRILELLLKERPEEAEITERVLEAAASNLEIGDTIMDYILSKYGDAIEISERVLEAASRNEEKGEKIMSFIFRRRDRALLITERVLEAAVQNARCGLDIVGFFLKAGIEIQMTSRLLKAAVESKSISARQIAMMLLEACNDRVQLTESVIQACVRAGAREIMGEFVESRINDIQVTERAIGLIAKTWPFRLMELLQERKEDIQITPKVLAECAAGAAFLQKVYMERLLQMTTGKIRVTSSIVEAAATNEDIGEEMMELLLEERGDEFKITEKIMREAAKNKRRGAQIINILIRERGQSGEIRVSERLLEEAAGNEGDGYEIIDLLLQESGDSIQLIDTIAEIAAENKGCGERIIELFRMRKRFG